MLDTQRRYYVYIWFKPDDTPFYVGKGSGDRWKRHGCHHRNIYFQRIYEKYPGCYSRIIIDCVDEATAFKKEKEWIEQLKSFGFRLANLSKGGEGTGKKTIVTQDFRDKMRLLVTGEKNPNYGNHWTSEQKKHQSELKKTKGTARFGNNPRSKEVMCVETGRIYSCQIEAAIDLGLKGMGSIYHALKKPSFVAAGYHFVASDDIKRLNTPEKRQQYLSSIQSR